VEATKEAAKNAEEADKKAEKAAKENPRTRAIKPNLKTWNGRDASESDNSPPSVQNQTRTQRKRNISTSCDGENKKLCWNSFFKTIRESKQHTDGSN